MAYSAVTQVPLTDFFTYVNERYAIWQRRAAGLPAPWTKDPILRDWKFTNVFRSMDRGSVWLQQHILVPYRNETMTVSLSDLLFMIVLYRQFNWYPTMAALMEAFGDIDGGIRHWKPKLVKTFLEERMRAGQLVFTSAHLVRSAVGRGKIDSVVDILTDVWHARQALTKTAVDRKSAEVVFHAFHKFEYLGDFMAYQFVLDLMETPILNEAKDLASWACVGPGAVRGLRYLFTALITPHTGLPYMHKLREMAPTCLDQSVLDHKRLWYGKGMRLDPYDVHDVEFNLCEFGKYCKLTYDKGEKARNKFRPHAVLPEDEWGLQRAQMTTPSSTTRTQRAI